MVRRISEETEDPAFARELEELASRIESYVAKQKDIEAYNRAVGHANKGEYSSAERILARLAANAKIPN